MRKRLTLLVVVVTVACTALLGVSAKEPTLTINGQVYGCQICTVQISVARDNGDVVAQLCRKTDGTVEITLYKTKLTADDIREIAKWLEYLAPTTSGSIILTPHNQWGNLNLDIQH